MLTVIFDFYNLVVLILWVFVMTVKIGHSVSITLLLSQWKQKNEENLKFEIKQIIIKF